MKSLGINTESKEVVIAAAVVGAGSMLFYAVSPILLGKLADQYSLSLSQLGWIAGANMLGLFLPNITGAFWINRIDRRASSIVLSLAASLIYFAAIFAGTFEAIIGAAFLFGMATGAAYGISLAILGETDAPDRSFAISFFLQVVAAVIVTNLIATFSVADSFTVLSIAMLISLGAAFVLPRRSRKGQGARRSDSSAIKNFSPLLLGLAAIIFVLIGESAIWTFLERIAVSNNLQSTAGAQAVSLSLVAAAAGSGSAALLSTRFGRLAPMTIAIVISLLSLIVFARSDGVQQYLIAAIMYGWAWNFGAAYRMGLVASVDHDGRWITYIPAMQMLGAIIGPVVAGQLAKDGGFALVYLFTGVVWSLGFGFFIAALKFGKPAIQNQSSIPDNELSLCTEGVKKNATD